MTGKELIKLLEGKGWKPDRIKGSHHIIIKWEKTLSVPVHGKKDLSTGILHKLHKEGGIQR
jgi:predicted RNA binding protein YcfA (HicA-like mRNA interferase family)